MESHSSKPPVFRFDRKSSSENESSKSVNSSSLSTMIESSSLKSLVYVRRRLLKRLVGWGGVTGFAGLSYLRCDWQWKRMRLKGCVLGMNGRHEGNCRTGRRKTDVSLGHDSNSLSMFVQ